MTAPSTLDKFNCAERELRLRRRVYARLVLKGNMRQEKADHEIELMEAIVNDYRFMLEQEAPQLKLGA